MVFSAGPESTTNGIKGPKNVASQQKKNKEKKTKYLMIPVAMQGLQGHELFIVEGSGLRGLFLRA